MVLAEAPRRPPRANEQSEEGSKQDERAGVQPADKDAAQSEESANRAEREEGAVRGNKRRAFRFEQRPLREVLSVVAEAMGCAWKETGGVYVFWPRPRALRETLSAAVEKSRERVGQPTSEELAALRTDTEGRAAGRGKFPAADLSAESRATLDRLILHSLAVRMDGVGVEGALRAVALALGEAYRWRRQGKELVLVRVAAPRRWKQAFPRETADELRQGLTALGLIEPGEEPHPAPRDVRGGPADATPLVKGGRAFAEMLVAALPPELAEEAASEGGIPVSALPRELQEDGYVLAVPTGIRLSVSGILSTAAELATNPLVVGRPPRDLRIGQAEGRWAVFYAPPVAGGPTSRGVIIPGSDGRSDARP